MLKNKVLYVINGVNWINSMELNVGGLLYSDFSLEMRNFIFSEVPPASDKCGAWFWFCFAL